MTRLEIRDLEMSEELDKKALESLTGGRWVQRSFYQRVTRIGFHKPPQRVRRVTDINRATLQSNASTSLQRYTRLVWL